MPEFMEQKICQCHYFDLLFWYFYICDATSQVDQVTTEVAQIVMKRKASLRFFHVEIIENSRLNPPSTSRRKKKTKSQFNSEFLLCRTEKFFSAPAFESCIFFLIFRLLENFVTIIPTHQQIVKNMPMSIYFKSSPIP